MRRALKSLAAGTGNPEFSVEINYRSDEKYWVVAAKSDITIAFALNFDNVTDRALARIFLLVLFFYDCLGIQRQQAPCKEPPCNRLP